MKEAQTYRTALSNARALTAGLMAHIDSLGLELDEGAPKAQLVDQVNALRKAIYHLYDTLGEDLAT